MHPPDPPVAPLLIMPAPRSVLKLDPVEPRRIEPETEISAQKSPEIFLVPPPPLPVAIPALVSPNPFAPATVLIVESDFSIRKLLGRLLERRGYLTVEIAQTEDLAAALRDLRADLLVMDVSLAGTNAAPTLAALAADHPSLKILALSPEPLQNHEVPGRFYVGPSQAVPVRQLRRLRGPPAATLRHANRPGRNFSAARLPYLTVAVLIAVVYDGWIFYARWSGAREAQKAEALKQVQDARRTLELLGGDSLKILDFYASPPVIRRGVAGHHLLRCQRGRSRAHRSARSGTSSRHQPLPPGLAPQRYGLQTHSRRSRRPQRHPKSDHQGCPLTLTRARALSDSISAPGSSNTGRSSPFPRCFQLPPRPSPPPLLSTPPGAIIS